MKNVIVAAALTALTGSAFAQLNPLPPSSVLDGVGVQGIGLNAGATHWNNPATLGAFNFASDDNFGAPDPVALGWGILPPVSVISHLGSIDADGGSIKAIFTGESAGWLNDFGYTYSGNPAGPNSFTVFSDIQAAAPSVGNPFPTTIAFGDHIDVSFDIADNVSTFDFWLNGVGQFGPNNGAGLGTGVGGVFTAIHPTNSTPYIAGQVLWAPRPIFVNTWIPSLGVFADVATYLVGFEDWRLDAGADGDNNDFVFALQFYKADGTPFTPVPEPATYGIIGALALVGLIARRRFQSKKAA